MCINIHINIYMENNHTTAYKSYITNAQSIWIHMSIKTCTHQKIIQSTVTHSQISVYTHIWKKYIYIYMYHISIYSFIPLCIAVAFEDPWITRSFPGIYPTSRSSKRSCWRMIFDSIRSMRCLYLPRCCWCSAACLGDQLGDGRGISSSEKILNDTRHRSRNTKQYQYQHHQQQQQPGKFLFQEPAPFWHFSGNAFFQHISLILGIFS